MPDNKNDITAATLERDVMESISNLGASIFHSQSITIDQTSLNKELIKPHHEKPGEKIINAG